MTMTSTFGRCFASGLYDIGYRPLGLLILVLVKAFLCVWWNKLSGDVGSDDYVSLIIVGIQWWTKPWISRANLDNWQLCHGLYFSLSYTQGQPIDRSGWILFLHWYDGLWKIYISVNVILFFCGRCSCERHVMVFWTGFIIHFAVFCIWCLDFFGCSFEQLHEKLDSALKTGAIKTWSWNCSPVSQRKD